MLYFEIKLRLKYVQFLFTNIPLDNRQVFKSNPQLAESITKTACAFEIGCPMNAIELIHCPLDAKKQKKNEEEADEEEVKCQT